MNRSITKEPNFRELEDQLLAEFDFQKDDRYRSYLQDPKNFRSLDHVIKLLRGFLKQSSNFSAFHQDPNYKDLQKRQKLADDIIEEVVRYKQGGLTKTVETMGEVVRSYMKGLEDIRHLKQSMQVTKEILTNKNKSQHKLSEMWLRKSELEESLRIIGEIEFIQEAPPRIQKLISQRRYLAAVTTLNKATEIMFHNDLNAVAGLSTVRETLLDLKENIVEKILNELQDAVHGSDDYGRGVGAVDRDEDQSLEDGVFADDDYSSRDDSRSDDARTVALTVNGHEAILNDIDGVTSTAFMQGNQFHTGAAVSHDQLINMFQLTDAVENRLPQPPRTGGLFLQLLVKSVSELGKEDDFERLIFDRLSYRFRIKILKYERMRAISKLKSRNSEFEEVVDDNDVNNRIVSDESSFVSGNTQNQFHGKMPDNIMNVRTNIFTKYISSVLDQSVNCLKRVTFVLKLLSWCRSLRMQILGSNQSYMDDSGDDTDDDDNNDTQKQQSESSKAAIIDHTKLTQQPTRDTFAITDQPLSNFAMKTINISDVRTWWTEVETIICNEIKLHLKDLDVDTISDSKYKMVSSLSNAYGSNGEDTGMINASVDGDDDDHREHVQPIVPPTTHLGTPLYKRIMHHESTVSTILIQEKIYSTCQAKILANHPNIQDLASLTNSKFSNYDCNLKYTVLQHIAAHEESVTSNTYNSILVDYIDSFIEKDLLPITQSYVNSEMRDIQLHASLLFSTGTYVKSKQTGATKQVDHSNDHTITIFNQSIVLSKATVKCSNALQRLFTYWYELPDHREMVVTIVDRLVRGFAACASEEIDNVTWRSLSHEDKYLKTCQTSLQANPFFISYRQKLYRGKTLLDDVIKYKTRNLHYTKAFSSLNINETSQKSSPPRNNGSNNAASTTPSSSSVATNSVTYSTINATNGINSDASGGKETPVLEPRKASPAVKGSGTGAGARVSTADFSAWAVFFGSIGNVSSSYPVSREKTVKDFNVIETVASIVLGCDWLAFELVKYCDYSVSRCHKDSVVRANGFSGLNHSAHDDSEGSAVREGETALWRTTKLVSGILAKISETSIAFLKCEIQIVSFLHLHQLANISALKAVFIRPGISQVEQPHGTKVTASSLVSSLINDSAEAEIVFSEFLHHVQQMFLAMSSPLPREVICVIIHPLCTLVPRILMRCIQHLLNPHTSVNQLYTGGPSSTSTVPSDSRTKKSQFIVDSRKYLRIVIIAQQTLLNLVDSFQLESSFLKIFSDQLMEETERLRKYLKLLEMNSKELKNYIKERSTEYTPLEYITLWDCMCARSESRQPIFEEFWKSIQ